LVLQQNIIHHFAYSPTKNIAQAGLSGPAPVIIQGLSLGMISTIAPTLIICISIVVTVILGDYAGGQGSGVYGISIAAVGMLSTLGVTLATDAYGPVADNAGGLAEMAQLPGEVRERTDALDALGNTTAATGKGFAIGSAVLTALALLNAFANASGVTTISLLEKEVMAGIIFGACLPYIFSALTMTAVAEAAMQIIIEVRRQFKEIPGLLEGKRGVNADHAACVDISTKSALQKMIAPGVLSILAPIAIGFAGRQKMLAGLLTGSISSGFLLAVTMANAGGAWDNAKKYVESGQMIDPETKEKYTKGSEVHKACVCGDTVGDPFKDTSGPALNILIKLMTIISLVIGPVLKTIYPDS
jgi:K(+)-stimulated pyrophosphate-energized sodium pump